MTIEDLFQEELFQSRKTRSVSVGVDTIPCEEGTIQGFLRNLPPIVWLPAWGLCKIISNVLPGVDTTPTLHEWSDSASLGSALFNAFAVIVWVNVTGLVLGILQIFLV